MPEDTQPSRGGALNDIAGLITASGLAVGSFYNAVHPQTAANAQATVIRASGEAVLTPLLVVGGLGILLYLAFRRN